MEKVVYHVTSLLSKLVLEKDGVVYDVTSLLSNPVASRLLFRLCRAWSQFRSLPIKKDHVSMEALSLYRLSARGMSLQSS